MSDPEALPDFTALPDLAAVRLGGVVLEANDEFFAPKENLLRPDAPTFDPLAYTDRGKEMDGWETRRRREPGHDHCTIRLGVPGIVRGVVVDTSFFRGNYPERCSLEATGADDLEGADWFELLPESPLRGDARNPFAVDPAPRVTHLRLHIYPDGGVARLRVHGEPLPDLRAAVAGGVTDLAASVAGGWIEDASDRFFSSPHNLIAPGDPHGMHDGWETRRRRGPGHDWVVIRLAAEAELDRIEVDTSFFKGNYPDTCSVDARVGEGGWAEVLGRRKLEPDRRHAFELLAGATATHVRLNIYPDGGVARLRVHGRVTRAGWRSFGVRWLNALAPDAFEREVLACCASVVWAHAMREARPFPDFDAVLEASDAAWAGLGRQDRLEAFAAHPRIGDRQGSAWSRQEQAETATADEEVLRALAEGNRAYEGRFGHVFLINATGRGPEGMLAELRRRMGNDADAELEEAAEQQRQIARIRLEKLVRPPA
ncbi:MAG TPA: allantoicase [Actinomycetota bacterium]|nr:allantoicase [Actinomycetota bacterium]